METQNWLFGIQARQPVHTRRLGLPPFLYFTDNKRFTDTLEFLDDCLLQKQASPLTFHICTALQQFALRKSIAR